ncbi:hypothetical protein VNO78_03085 [Psophocarpus tetragonolobus]|uniref:Uncharacterized protein n=1 Tax=Psophocarpus tetragonolobus TaxID=3891 RepID=A0AAN9TDA5_PSOTE
MVYSKAPTAYYSTLHDSITSLCKTILPLGLKKKCLVSAERRLWQLQSENLKWQQDSLHHMLNLMALHRDDILSDADVSSFRSHLLDTLLASPPPHLHHAIIIKDNLLFLQELLSAKCISEGEYHSSRRPLLVRLAIHGGEIEGRDVIIAGSKENSEEQWSEIDLKDENCMMNKENSNSKKTLKHARKQVVKGATSVLNYGSSFKLGKNTKERSIFDSTTLHMHSAQAKVHSPSIYSQSELSHSKENKPNKAFWDGPEKLKRKPFRALFHRDKNKKEGQGGGDDGLEAKKQWGFDGLRKGKKSDSDDDTVPLSLNERSDSEAHLPLYQLSSSAYGDVSMQNKLHSDLSPSDFSVNDKVLGRNIKQDLSRTPTEMRTTNTNLNFSSDHKQANSTKLPEDKANLKNDFPKPPWYDHGGEMENMSNDAAHEKHENLMGWTTFEDEENLHPNLSVYEDKSLRRSSINPFSHGYL